MTEQQSPISKLRGNPLARPCPNCRELSLPTDWIRVHGLDGWLREFRCPSCRHRWREIDKK